MTAGPAYFSTIISHAPNEMIASAMVPLKSELNGRISGRVR